MTELYSETEAEFTPSTAQVRSHYVFDQADRWVPERGVRFDRWLVERDAAIVEAAAREADRGYLASESCDDIAARIRALAPVAVGADCQDGAADQVLEDAISRTRHRQQRGEAPYADDLDTIIAAATASKGQR